MQPKPKLGNKIVNRHGLISSAISRMPLETQVTVASVVFRAYEITVPWNMPPVPLPNKAPNNFPKIDDISD